MGRAGETEAWLTRQFGAKGWLYLKEPVAASLWIKFGDPAEARESYRRP
jgi:hypothetical protein